MLPSEIVAPLLADEQKEAERWRPLVVANDSLAHAVEKIEKKNTCDWVLIFYSWFFFLRKWGHPPGTLCFSAVSIWFPKSSQEGGSVVTKPPGILAGLINSWLGAPPQILGEKVLESVDEKKRDFVIWNGPLKTFQRRGNHVSSLKTAI